MSKKATRQSHARIGAVQEAILNTLFGDPNSTQTRPKTATQLGNILRILEESFAVKYSKARVQDALVRLAKNGFVSTESTQGGKKYFSLTEKGQREVSRLALKHIELRHKQLRWDGKWRVIIFDITENNRRTRDLLRKQLVALDFVQLQQSVWITPYDSEEIVALIKTGFGLGSDVVHMLVDKVENDKKLRTHFKL